MTGLVVAADADFDFRTLSLTFAAKPAPALLRITAAASISHWNVCSNSHKAAPRGRCSVSCRPCSYVAKSTPKTEFAAKPVPMACCLFRQLAAVSAVTRAGLKLSMIAAAPRPIPKELM